MMIDAYPVVWRIIAAGAVVLSASTSSSAKAVSPGKLRYGGQVGQTVAYRIQVIADRNEATETLKGVVTYKFNAVDEGKLQVTYSGGLSKSSKAKPSQSSSQFGPRRIGPPRFGGPSRAFGPFSDMPFKGLTTTTNDLTLTPLGEIQSMKGDSQLPYLLGNASLLIFESLPEESKSSWSVDSGISITEEGGRRGPPFHIPFGMSEPKRTTAGSEVFTYNVRSVEGPKIVVDKTYRLDSPAPNEKEAGFEINGTGTWIFNRELGVPESLEFKQKLVVHKGNVTVEVPTTIKYNRLTQAQLAEYQEEQRRKQDETRQRLAEIQEKRANTPLTKEKKTKLLSDLKSNNTSVVLMALQTLQNKKAIESDPQLALAVRALQQHKSQFVRQRAEKVLEKLGAPADTGSSVANMRTWTDNSGTFELEAEFVELKGDTVRLRRDDGSELEVPLDRLSEGDRKAARELGEGAKPLDNPFQ